MNRNEEHILETLIAGGVIGAALGALLSNEKGEGAVIGAIAGAAILATYNAYEQAQKNNLSVYAEKDGKLFEIQPNGDKVFIKDIPKHNISIQDHFKLK